MREIKFRGKRISDGDWFYGDLVTVVNGDFAVERSFIHIRLSEIGFVQDALTARLCLHEVNLKTVGQYTGIKDRNGKEIYEGDILINLLDKVGNVVWDDESLSYILKYKDGFDYLSDCGEGSQITEDTNPEGF